MDMPLTARSGSQEVGHVLGAADYLCWSKMQAESGQQLSAIIERKERERIAGSGCFFWGVGNAPSIAVRPLARLGVSVPVVFSTMKSKPKRIDQHPKAILVWRKYFDLYDVERELPPHVLITSRAHSGAKAKTRHYALMCLSHEPLMLRKGTSFDPTAFRNAGPMGASLGASQVTALVRRVRPSTEVSVYEANLHAELTGSYWVRLSDPAMIDSSVGNLMHERPPEENAEWISLVARLRESSQKQAVSNESTRLL